MTNTDIFIAVCVFFSSVVSSCLGIGGGSILMASLSLIFSAPMALGIHAVSQFIGCINRSLLFYKSVNWSVAAAISITIFVGALGAGFLLGSINIKLLKGLIGVFLLLSLFALKPQGPKKINTSSTQSSLFGLIIGFLGPIVGSVGVFLSAFLIYIGQIGPVLVGTKSIIQLSTHGSRLIVYNNQGGAFTTSSLKLILIIAICSLIGSWVGKKYIKIENPAVFINLSKLFVGTAGLFMIYQSI